MSALERTCHYCGEPVDLNDHVNVWQGTWGFAPRGGKRPSGHKVSGDLYNRQAFDRWAHGHCVKLNRSGVHPGQEALV